MYDTHETSQPVAFKITTTNFDEIEDKHQKFYSDKGVGSGYSEPYGKQYSDAYRILSSIV